MSAYYRRRNRRVSTGSKSVAAGLLLALLIAGVITGSVAFYAGMVSTSPLSGYAPLNWSGEPFVAFALLFTIAVIVVIVRGLIKGASVSFISPRHAVTGRIKFFASTALVLVLVSFLSAQGDLSRGSDPLSKAANYFRFAGEYNIVTRLPLGLTEYEKELIDISLARYKTPEAFASSNVSPARQMPHAKKRGNKGVSTAGVGVRTSVAHKTPAAIAFEKAVTRTFGVLLLIGSALVLFALSYAVKLFVYGHKLWLSFTTGKRTVMKALNLLYYLGYVPMVITFGFVHSFKKMPSFHGSPGRFAKTQAIARTAIACVLLAVASCITIRVFPAPTLGLTHLIAAVAILSLAVTAGWASIWAKRAWKGYAAEKRVAIEVMEACIGSNRIDGAIRTGAKADVFWGMKYRYSRRTESRDIASLVARFVKRVFGKDEQDTADIDLSVKYALPGDAVGWLVCEVKSYNAWNRTGPVWQATNNADRIRKEETEGANGLIVLPAVISPERTREDGWKERITARICIDNPPEMTVRQLLDTGLSETVKMANEARQPHLMCGNFDS